MLDALGARWEYEPEGFDLGNGLKYLPDFCVKNVYIKTITGKPVKLYVEVKGELSDIDEDKISRFSGSVEEDGMYENPILVVGEIPAGDDVYDLLIDMDCKYKMDDFNSIFFSFSYIMGDYYNALLGVGEKNEIVVFGGDYVDVVDHERTINAYKKARQARFEHGEHGV